MIKAREAATLGAAALPSSPERQLRSLEANATLSTGLRRSKAKEEEEALSLEVPLNSTKSSVGGVGYDVVFKARPVCEDARFARYFRLLTAGASMSAVLKMIADDATLSADQRRVAISAVQLPPDAVLAPPDGIENGNGGKSAGLGSGLDTGPFSGGQPTAS